MHKSISESVVKLQAQYNNDSRIHKAFQELCKAVKSLPKEVGKNASAIRCIDRFLSNVCYLNFVDPVSRVSTKQLLGFAWLAINDATDKSEAKERLIEGLYEIQRGYNLDENNVDDNGGDRPICIPGTFNKIMEKLVGINANVQIVHITKETATAKLQCVVKEAYKKLQGDARQDWWSQIKKSVAEEMADYRPPFASDAEFKEFVECGQYASIDESSSSSSP